MRAVEFPRKVPGKSRYRTTGFVGPVSAVVSMGGRNTQLEPTLH
jgi:hypothetical protein